MNFNIVLILIFSISILRECSSFPSFPHIQGGPSVPKLLTNTIENKYHWKCLDASSDPLYVLECNKQPSQTRFSLEIPHQSYHNCERPIKIFGQSNTILGWNTKDNTLQMISQYYAEHNNTKWCLTESNYEGSFLVHPYDKPNKCLSAPLKEGDPVTVISCRVKNDEQTLGIAWTFLITKTSNI